MSKFEIPDMTKKAKKNRQTYTLAIPESFDAKSIPELAEDNMTEAAWFVLHRIIVGGLQKRLKPTDYVNLHSQKMDRILGVKNGVHIWQKVKGILIDHAVIACNDAYCCGVMSKGYRLAKAYAQDEIKSVKINIKTLAKKLHAWRFNLESKVVKRTELEDIHQKLLSCLEKVDSVDGAEAYGSRAEFTLKELKEKQADFSVCHFGRIHTPITRLKGEARALLRFDGKPLVSIDIKNSQPIFFSILYADYCIQNGKDLDSRFLQLVYSGTLYNELMAKTGYTDRKEFKGEFFKGVFYGDPTKKYVKESKIAAVFKAEFPSVWKFMCDKKKTAYEELAREMQIAESNFMIKGVVRRIFEKYPDMLILTIHDSILVTEEHVDAVIKIILSEFKIKGIDPTLEIERY